MREGEALFTPIKTDLYFLMRASFKKEVFENETFFPLKAASVFARSFLYTFCTVLMDLRREKQ